MLNTRLNFYSLHFTKLENSFNFFCKLFKVLFENIITKLKRKNFTASENLTLRETIAFKQSQTEIC